MELGTMKRAVYNRGHGPLRPGRSRRSGPCPRWQDGHYQNMHMLNFFCFFKILPQNHIPEFDKITALC